MKKRILMTAILACSLTVFTACGKEKPDGRGTVTSGEDVGVDENASGPEEGRGRLEDEGENEVSGSIVPVVSGSLTPVELDEDEVVDSSAEKDTETAMGEELWAMVSSEEEAQEIADTYGITLVLYDQGVATYHTEEDPGTVVQRGRDNGWPAIAVNTTSTLVE